MAAKARVTRGRWLLVVAASATAGLLADLIGMPAGWLVGPMLATLLLSVGTHVRARVPRGVNMASQAVIGIALSASFSPESLHALGRHWAPVLFVLAAVLLFSLGSGLLLARLGVMDAATASLGTLPGGASGMVAMSDDLGADARLVAFMQYARLILVVVLAAAIAKVMGVTSGGAEVAAGVGPSPGEPIASEWGSWLFTAGLAGGGAWAGVRLRIPAGALMGPVLLGVVLGALGIPHGALPPGILQASYLLIGVWVGSRFDMVSLRQMGRVAPSVVALALLLIGGCALLGLGLSLVTGMDPLTAYLATTPGGMDSVAIAALDSGADTSVVLAVQMGRVLAVIFAGPPLVRWLARRREPGATTYTAPQAPPG